MVRYTKHLALVLALCFVLSAFAGCAAKPQEDKTPEDPALDNLMAFPGVRWTMSPQEVMDALGLTEAGSGDREATGNATVTYKSGSCVIQFEGISVFDQPANGKFSFTDYTGDGSYYLDSIKVNYPKGSDIQAVRSAMMDAYKEPAASTGYSSQWTSDIMLSNCVTKEQQKNASSKYSSEYSIKQDVVFQVEVKPIDPDTPLIFAQWIDQSYVPTEDDSSNDVACFLDYISKIGLLIQLYGVSPEFFQ